MNKRILFAPLVCICLYCIFAFSAYLLPLFALLCPVTIMLFGAFSLFKNSRLTLYLGTVVIVAVTYIINDDLVYSMVYSLGYVAAGFTLCYTILRGKSGANTCCICEHFDAASAEKILFLHHLAVAPQGSTNPFAVTFLNICSTQTFSWACSIRW